MQLFEALVESVSVLNIDSRLQVRGGALVCLYPGTVYQPHQPVLLQSIGNQYIFRCGDGVLIDGSSRGISRTIFRSCTGRDQVGW